MAWELDPIKKSKQRIFKVIFLDTMNEPQHDTEALQPIFKIHRILIYSKIMFYFIAEKG